MQRRATTSGLLTWEDTAELTEHWWIQAEKRGNTVLASLGGHPRMAQFTGPASDCC
jgi:hypothetical protein